MGRPLRIEFDEALYHVTSKAKEYSVAVQIDKHDQKRISKLHK